MNSALIFGLLIALMLTGMPVSIALGLTVLSFLFVMTSVPIEAVALKLFTGDGGCDRLHPASGYGEARLSKTLRRRRDRDLGCTRHLDSAFNRNGAGCGGHGRQRGDRSRRQARPVGFGGAVVHGRCHPRPD